MTFARSFALQPYLVQVAAPDDVNLLRQQVRASAHELGLTLGQQAKLTIAAATMASAIVANSLNVKWMVHVVTAQRHDSLEVACLVPTISGDKISGDALPLEMLRGLVDRVTVRIESGTMHCSLRTHLPQLRRNVARYTPPLQAIGY